MHEFGIEMIYHWVAIVCFAVAFSLSWSFIRRGKYLSRKVSYPIIMLGFMAMTAFLLGRGWASGSCPIGNPFEMVSLIVWSAVALHICVSLVVSVNFLGFFVAGFSMISLFAINWIPGLDYTYSPEDIHSSHIIGFHAALGIFSYGILAMSFLLAIMYLVQFHGLMKRRSGGFFSFMPPLVQLEKMQLNFWGLGIFALTLSLVIGLFGFFSEVVDVPHSKLIATSLVWAFGTLLLLLKLLNRLFATKFAWSIILGFALALLALAPIDQARHHSDSKAGAIVETDE